MRIRNKDYEKIEAIGWFLRNLGLIDYFIHIRLLNANSTKHPYHLY